MGMIATASHNPREFNGLKCIAADGLEVPREAWKRPSKEAAEAGDVCTVPYDSVGSIHPVVDGAIGYVDGIVHQALDAARIRKRHFTVGRNQGDGEQHAAASESCSGSPG